MDRRRRQSTNHGARRGALGVLARAATLARAAAALTIALAAAACGDAGLSEWEDYRDPIFADVYLHNATDAAVEVELRRFTDPHGVAEGDPQALCERIAADPAGELLGTNLGLILGEAQYLTLPPGATAPARDMNEEWPCHAVLVEDHDPAQGVSREPAILFWLDGQIPEEWVQGTIEDPAEHRAGAVALDFDPDGVPSFVQPAGGDVVFATVD